MCKKNDTIRSSDEIERNELLIWIPKLMKAKINVLSINQLRVLHYILGYNCKEASSESLTEELEGYGYSENLSLEIVDLLKRDNYLLIEKPY